MTPLAVSAVDYHTAGEPFRIVTGGVPPLRGATILAKRRDAMERLDHVRRLLVNEPRGHADMYGCFVVEPNDDAGDLGVVFFHNAGYSTACGHGTIALVTWALESGVVALEEGQVEVTVDVPSGRLATVARVVGGRVESVRFRNVPSFVHTSGLVVSTSAGRIAADVSFGGAFYAGVDATQLGLLVRPENVNSFIELGRQVKASIEKELDVVHPEEPELRDVYGVMFYEDLGHDGNSAVQRNVTIFADGEVDRSPCGSGTSARLAVLDAGGRLERGRTLRHLSIIDSAFTSAVVGDAEVAGVPAVITEVEGSAFMTGVHHFVRDDRDALGTGFLLR